MPRMRSTAKREGIISKERLTRGVQKGTTGVRGVVEYKSKGVRVGYMVTYLNYDEEGYVRNPKILFKEDQFPAGMALELATEFRKEWEKLVMEDLATRAEILNLVRRTMIKRATYMIITI